MNEVRKKQIINAVCKKEKFTMLRAELLLSASVNFIKRKAWQEAEVCNNEALKLLADIMQKILANKEFLNNKVANS